jgi:ABC-type glycerol-3-phosphate transport system substrate-binding protein
MRIQGRGALGGVVAGGLMLAAGAAVAEEITLNVWSDPVRLTMFDLYDKTHDNVKLNVTTIDPAGLVAKIQLGMQSKSEVPDVIFMNDIGYAAQLSTRRSNYLLDLTGKVPQSVLDEFYPNANSPCYINGKLLCLRNDIAHDVVWYDKPLMESLGLEVPTTWEEFQALGDALVEKGYSLGSPIVPFQAFLVTAGCDMVMPVAGKDDTVKIDLTTEKCLKPARLIDHMIAKGSLAKVDPFDPSVVEQVKSGKVPLLIGPTWFGEYVIKPTYEMAPGKLAVALPLRWEDQEQPLTWSWGGGVYGGWKDTKHPEAVADLITWMASDVANQTNAVTLPAHRPSALAWGERLKSDPFYASPDAFDVQVKAAEYSHPGYTSLRFSVEEAIVKIVSANIAKGGTVEASLPALQTELVNLAKLNGYTVE